MEEKKELKVDEKYNGRHSFVFSVNGNIVCARNFNVNGFNYNALRSAELYDAFVRIVNEIKADFVSKSQVYLWMTSQSRVKLTGFVDNYEGLTENDVRAVCDNYIDGKIALSDGRIVEKKFLELDAPEDRPSEPCVYKFSYCFDRKPVYETEWDATVYPPHVRNSVNLSNIYNEYSDDNKRETPYVKFINREIYANRKNLIRYIIDELCYVLGDEIDENGKVLELDYTKEINGYHCSTRNSKYYRGWEEATRQKTIQYNRWVNWDLSDKMVAFIDNRL